MHVHFCLADLHGPGYYRGYLPLSRMTTLGHTSTHATSMPDFEICREQGVNVLVGQRLVEPPPTIRWQAMARDDRRDFALVLDLDDDLWNIDRSNDAHSFFDADRLRRLKENVACADMVTVSTDHLANVVAEHTKVPVVVLENTVPEFLLNLKPEHTANDRDGNVVIGDDDLVIGWAGSSTHDRDFGECAKSVKRVIQANPRTIFHCICSKDYTGRVKSIKGRTHWTGWINGVENYYRMVNFDIGLAPLYPFPFNDSKCIDAEALITTRRGVIAARDITPEDHVWHNNEWQRVEATHQEVPRPGIKITTDLGYVIKLTPEHRMMVNGVWMTADRIRPGDVMSAEPESVGRMPYQTVPWPVSTRFGPCGEADLQAYLLAPDVPRLTITPRWGRFLGAYVGDGSVGQATQVRIACDGQDQDWIDLLMQDIEACGLHPTTEQKKTFDGKTLRRREVRVASAHLVRVLVSLGLAEVRDNGKPKRICRIPRVIWQSPRSVIAEFLAGYFEADGCASGTCVKVTSIYENLAREVQRMLLLFGIESRLSQRETRAQNGYIGSCWVVQLNRAATDVFAKEIGFRSQRKTTRLQKITDRPHSNAYRPMSWQWKVTGVEPCFVTPVDLQVNGKVFAAGGFVSHNSDIRLLELGALGIPVIASYVGPYRRAYDEGYRCWLANSPKEWTDTLTHLVKEPDTRKKLGAGTREWVRKRTTEANVHQWIAAYQQVLSA